MTSSDHSTPLILTRHHQRITCDTHPGHDSNRLQDGWFLNNFTPSSIMRHSSSSFAPWLGKDYFHKMFPNIQQLIWVRKYKIYFIYRISCLWNHYLDLFEKTSFSIFWGPKFCQNVGPLNVKILGSVKMEKIGLVFIEARWSLLDKKSIVPQKSSLYAIFMYFRLLGAIIKQFCMHSLTLLAPF